MFELLSDYASFLLSWRWPKTDGTITGIDILDGRQLAVVYEFSLSGEGPYAGRSAMPAWFSGPDLTSINESLRVGQEVAVRYRRSNPSLNRLDWSVWQNLQAV
jgi:hypothetical protein